MTSNGIMDDIIEFKDDVEFDDMELDEDELVGEAEQADSEDSEKEEAERQRQEAEQRRIEAEAERQRLEEEAEERRIEAERQEAKRLIEEEKRLEAERIAEGKRQAEAEEQKRQAEAAEQKKREDEQASNSRAAKKDKKAEKKAEQKEPKKPKAQEKSKQAESKNQPEAPAQSKKAEMVLYIVTDRPKTNMIKYMRGAGLKVSRIFSTITQATDRLMMQTDPCRLVIMDTGMGKFTSTIERAKLIDMLGIADEDTQVMVFYTDSAIKSDAYDAMETQIYKRIKWFKYASTPEVIARVLALKENYKLPANSEKVIEYTFEEAMKSKGMEKLDIKTGYKKGASIGIPAISTDLLNMNMLNSKEELLEEFDVKY